MKESEKSGLIYEQKVQEKYPPGFSPTVNRLSLEDVIKGTWSLREENGKVLVDVQGSVNLSKKNLSRLPWNFGIVTGDFDCSENQLTTLQGAPQEVNGYFYCFHNSLETLQGAPKKVGGGFYCSSNQLETLEGALEEVGGCFYCSFNQLETLEGAPEKVGGYFNCSDNPIKFTEEDIRRAQAQSRIRNSMSSFNRERFSLDTLSNISI